MSISDDLREHIEQDIVPLQVVMDEGRFTFEDAWDQSLARGYNGLYDTFRFKLTIEIERIGGETCEENGEQPRGELSRG